eukprot:364233-Chlamydomonas_euryale.AAC.4
MCSTRGRAARSSSSSERARTDADARTFSHVARNTSHVTDCVHRSTSGEVETPQWVQELAVGGPMAHGLRKSESSLSALSRSESALHGHRVDRFEPVTSPRGAVFLLAFKWPACGHLRSRHANVWTPEIAPRKCVDT